MMNQYGQGESSGGLSVHPLKRRRGRPRKDPSLKNSQAGRAPPGFEAAKGSLAQKVNKTNEVDSMVGQAVSGVVEATFDAGYLLNVRIGNSATYLRGVVFKPGHYVPVTAENDVAPHLQMIRRNDVHAPTRNQGRSRIQKLPVQTGAMVPLKQKYGAPQAAPSVPSVGVRGTLVPVVLEPVNLQNGPPTTNQIAFDTPRTPHMMAFGDNDVHMVEPLSMLPPDRSIPIGQIFLGSQPNTTNPVSQRTMRNGNEPFIKGGETNPLDSTNIDNPGSSESSDTETNSDKESPRSPAEDSGTVLIQQSGNTTGPFSTESMQSPSVTEPFFNYGTGKMTKLLQAVQENMKENSVQIAEPPPTGSNQNHETMAAETDPKNEASAP